MTERRVEPKTRPAWLRALDAVQTELVGIHPRLHAYNIAAGLLPLRASGALRAQLLRMAGFKIGSGTSVKGPLKLTGPRSLLPRLWVGSDTSIEPDCVFDLSEHLTIGSRVTIEPGVMILTSTHELDFPKHRAGPVILKPVTIGDGVWLRARSIIFPGVTVGDGAIVEAGSTVNKDVEPNTRVGGIPAGKLEVLNADQ